MNIAKSFWVDSLSCNKNVVVVDRKVDEAVGIWKLLKKTRKEKDGEMKIDYDFDHLKNEIELVYLNFTFNRFKSNYDGRESEWVSQREHLTDAIVKSQFAMNKDRLVQQIVNKVKTSGELKDFNGNIVTLEDMIAVKMDDWVKANIEEVFEKDCKLRIQNVVSTMYEKVLAWYRDYSKELWLKEVITFFGVWGTVKHGYIKNDWAGYWFSDCKTDNSKYKLKKLFFDWKEIDKSIEQNKVWPDKVQYVTNHFTCSLHCSNCNVKNAFEKKEGGYEVDFYQCTVKKYMEDVGKYVDEELKTSYSFAYNASRENLFKAGWTDQDLQKTPKYTGKYKKWDLDFTPEN